MTTLTLDKSRNALAVLAWRKGMTRKRFYSLASMHAVSKQMRGPVVIQSRAMTSKQASCAGKTR